MAQIIEKTDGEPAKNSLYLQNQVTSITSYFQKVQLQNLEKTSYSILVFFMSERGKKSACRVSFILVLHLKIAVIQSLRKADYFGASLKFAIFRHFVPIKKQQTRMKVILPRYI